MSNPILTSQKWDDPGAFAVPAGGVMTVEGTAFKTAILLGVLLFSMVMMFSQFWHHGRIVPAEITPWMIGGGIAALVLALIAFFAPKHSMAIGLLYAVAKGILLGGLTMFFEVRYPGLPLLAAVFTTVTLLATLAMYGLRIVRVGSGFVKGVMIATAGLMLGVGALALLGLFGIGGGIAAALGGSGPIGIGFSILCVVLATFNLLVDFHLIEQGAANRAPKWMEWAGAFGLLVTLAWLYIEILQLLRKLRED